MTRSAGNVRLRSARIAAGYTSQNALAEALGVGVRQVRRWESATPPTPHPEVGQRLAQMLGQTLEQLGFAPDHVGQPRQVMLAAAVGSALAVVPSEAAASMQPATVARDYEAVTRSHRRLYWSVAPSMLHPAAIAHATLGCALLPQTAGETRRRIASALAETYLLAGRVEFFDQQEPDAAAATLTHALQAAGEADDVLLGAAILAHSAFIPGWAGLRDKAVERMIAARTYARRGPAPAALWAWLDAVEAECETRCGNTATALHLIRHAEETLAGGAAGEVPEWFDWFTPGRLAAFKGNTQLTAGHLPQARTTLLNALDQLEPTEEKQRAVLLGDLAAVEAAAGEPEAACRNAVQALEQLERTWYATGMDRVTEVRRALAPYQNERCVRDLDDRLYGWRTTVSALAR
ncbi:helix-turn-helix transcriptional regulator [Streptomyces sp. NPDC102406]|uniref:helix-turn-helix transcriptional regulator n=1 Tax=Streptomyces sp. NPDC102406 TaxID=3366171 RepID=UPI0037F7743C